MQATHFRFSFVIIFLNDMDLSFSVSQNALTFMALMEQNNLKV